MQWRAPRVEVDFPKPRRSESEPYWEKGNSHCIIKGRQAETLIPYKSSCQAWRIGAHQGPTFYGRDLTFYKHRLNLNRLGLFCAQKTQTTLLR